MTVSIGICGTQHIHYTAYAPLLAAMDGVNFLGVADDDETRGETAAESVDCAYLESDELLSTADGVVVCSTNVEHVDWVERAGAHGTHVLSEKPLAPTLDGARSVVETADDANIHLGVAMPLRFSEPVRRANDTLTTDTLGELHSISGTNRGQMPGGWFVEPEHSGGGAVVDHTPHVVDVVQDLTGERVAEVYAESGTRFHDIPVDDVNVLSMELTDGTKFLHDGSWSRPDEWPTWGGATLDFCGTRGSLAIDCFGQQLGYSGSRSEHDRETIFWGPDDNERMLDDFRESLLDGRDPETTGADGLGVVAVIEAAYESIETGEPVAVE